MSLASLSQQFVNINDFSATQKQQHYKTIYSQDSYFQKKFLGDQLEIDCQQHSAALRGQITRLLYEKKIIDKEIVLENLHEHLSADMIAYNFDDGVNKISTYFYDTDVQFQNVYFDYLNFLRKQVIKEAFWFQATPTLRIHCPNGKNNHHYPRYHTDIGYGHPPEEINIWMPLTDILIGHGFRVMSVKDSREILKSFDYDFPAFINSAINNKVFSSRCENIAQPVMTPYGRMLAFDSRCIHSGEPLKVHTRISMDIRVLPLSEYAHMSIEYQGTGRRKMLFTPGHCYYPQHSDQLFI